MTYVIEIPIEGGGLLLAQVGEDDLPDGLELAARRGEIVARARESVEEALDEVMPAIRSVASRVRQLAADEVTVEFGVVFGIEAGAIVAKGSAESHFTVTLCWNRREVSRESPVRSSSIGGSETAAEKLPGQTSDPRPGQGSATERADGAVTATAISAIIVPQGSTPDRAD
jgi:hypothetical protein